MSIFTTLKKLASHVVVETPIVKPALSSKYMMGKAALYVQDHFKTGPNSYGCFHSKAHQEADETMLFTIVVLASRKSLLILLLVKLTKEQRGCNSSLSRKQFDAGKKALKDLTNILNSENRLLNSLGIISMISK